MTASTLASHGTCVWKNPRLSIKTKVTVYKASVLSTLWYGSECWIKYAAPERRLNVICAHCGNCLGFIGWAEHQTQFCFLDVDYQQCFVNAYCAGWDISEKWKTEESPKIFCTESSLRENATLGVPNYTIEMCASGTWRNWIDGKNRPLISPSWEVTCKSL